MKRVIGRKQSSTNDTWLYALEHIEELVSPQDVDAYAQWAVKRIQEATKGKTAAYA